MAQLFLVRHAQAAFGTDDYDRLTELGHRQARWLGDYFAERGGHFDRVVCGGLRRHRETVEGIAAAGIGMTPAGIDRGLDEYDPERLITAWQATQTGATAGSTPTPAGNQDRDARVRHFRQLRDALEAWSEGRLTVDGHRSFDAFARGAYQAFDSTWREVAGGNGRVLVVSSGGPIAAIIARHLATPPAAFVALNLQIRNASVAEFRIGRNAANLVSFNTVPHLDTRERREHITWS